VAAAAGLEVQCLDEAVDVMLLTKKSESDPEGILEVMRAQVRGAVVQGVHLVVWGEPHLRKRRKGVF